jgi:hypothetical protein
MPDKLTWYQPDDIYRGKPDSYRVWIITDHTGWREIESPLIDPCVDCYEMGIDLEAGGYVSLQGVWDNGGTSPRSVALPLPESGTSLGLAVAVLLLAWWGKYFSAHN